MLSLLVITLLVINLLIIYLHFVRGYEHLKGFIHGFYFDAEANFPSLYSALAISFCSMLLWVIARSDNTRAEKRSSYWKVLAIIFAFLAMDEFASIHEHMIQPVKTIIDGSPIRSDYLYFAWFIPYTVITLLILLAYARFFFKLPSRTRRLFASAAGLFLIGAVGMEIAGGKYWASQGWAVEGSDPVDLTYALIITIEELLEMFGIIIFIYALLDYHLRTTRYAFLLHVALSAPATDNVADPTLKPLRSSSSDSVFNRSEVIGTEPVPGD